MTSPLLPAISLLCLLACVGIFLFGCQSLPKCSPGKASRIDVNRASGPVTVNGSLNEKAWSKARPVPFGLVASPEQRKRIGALQEKGSARLLYDDKNLYVDFTFDDSDVVDRSIENDQELCTLSAVAEVFLKPKDEDWYWEFHVTPKGRVSTYWWPGGGPPERPTEHHVKPHFIEVATQVQGTVNHPADRDQGWTALVTIPFAKLDRFGLAKDPHSRWTVLLSRYNYSRYLTKGTGPELSAASPLSKPSYHLVDEYPQLQLRK